MDILSEIDQETQPGGRSCMVCVWLAKQPEAERFQWEEAMLDPTRVTRAIWRAMLKHNFMFTASPVSNHRKHPR